MPALTLALVEWIGSLGLVIMLGAGGVLLWRSVAPRLTGLAPSDTPGQGALIWLLGFLAFHAVILLTLTPEDRESLARMLDRQALASLVAVGVTLLAGARWRIGPAGLGLRPQRGGSALVAGAGAWMAFYPVFFGVALVNGWLLEALDVEDGVQAYLRMFAGDPAARSSPWTWLLMVGVLPTAEEILFRGALYGGLRRLLHPGLAALVGGLAFGLAHGGVALLPSAALGLALNVLYERTGSLSAPIWFHALHNAFTLAIVSLSPDLLQA